MRGVSIMCMHGYLPLPSSSSLSRHLFLIFIWPSMLNWAQERGAKDLIYPLTSSTAVCRL